MTLKLPKNLRFWGIDINVFVCKRTMSEMKSFISSILNIIAPYMEFLHLNLYIAEGSQDVMSWQ